MLLFSSWQLSHPLYAAGTPSTVSPSPSTANTPKKAYLQNSFQDATAGSGKNQPPESRRLSAWLEKHKGHRKEYIKIHANIEEV